MPFERLRRRPLRLGSLFLASAAFVGRPVVDQPRISPGFLGAFSHFRLGSRLVFARTSQGAFAELSRGSRVVGITGPRGVGKRTLAGMVYPTFGLLSLTDFRTRQALRAPVEQLLARYPNGLIVTDAQRHHSLSNWLAPLLVRDESRVASEASPKLVLCGLALESVPGLKCVRLGGLGRAETVGFPLRPETLEESMFYGGYPELHAQASASAERAVDYFARYLGEVIDRDTPQLLEIERQDSFEQVLRLLAQRSGLELNRLAVAAEVGVSHNTVKSWIELLASLGLCFLVPSWNPSWPGQQIKAPKLYFSDSGLLCHLRGITSPTQLASHPGRELLFESWVASELHKLCLDSGSGCVLRHFRRSRGPTFGLLLEQKQRSVVVRTCARGDSNEEQLRMWQEEWSSVRKRPGVPAEQWVVTAGEANSAGEQLRTIPWWQLGM